MFEGICAAIAEKHHLVVEAGTGIGKTFAYLIPAIYYSIANKKPVMISTNTINLQEQIVYKDIPFLQEVLPDKFTAVLAKGRSNYICRRRLQHALHFQSELFEHIVETQELKRIENAVGNLPVLPTSEAGQRVFDGSLSGFDWVPSDEVWSKICAESDNCAGKRCEFNEICFYQKARSYLWLSNIVVVNHPMLIIDAEMRYADNANLLPRYDVLIVDEAHSLESVAQRHLGLDISNYQINYLLGSLWNPYRQKGFLHFMPRRSVKTKACMKLVEDAKDSAELFFNDVEKWLKEKAPDNGRIKEKNFISNNLSPILADLGFALKELKAATFGNRKTKTKINKPEETSHSKSYDDVEIDAYIKRTMGFAQAIEAFICQSITLPIEQQSNEEDVSSVFWAEISKRRRTPARTTDRSGRQSRITLQSAPLKVNLPLKEMLLKGLNSAIYTSATLSVTPAAGKPAGSPANRGKPSGDSAGKAKEKASEKKENPNGLKYIKDALGIDASADLILDSPFDYEKQVKVYVTSNMPDPNDKNTFESLASERILHYLEKSKGRAFVLFTSYDLMNRIYERISPELMQRGVPLFMQGRDLPRHQMLEEFRSKVGSVILGADSFWQGVDVPGEALENIIITKLPFPVPSVPIVEARMEHMERAGIDSFMNYFMPEAILKMRQGVGRLIRAKTDKGIIVILDSRVVTKNYGRFFLQALPKCPVIIE